jgi:uncharacterized SAM-binding protein YcdF (DUF218 family)
MTTIDTLAQAVWDYHKLNQEPRPADMIFVLGSNDLRVADRAAELFLAGLAPRLVISGNVGVLSKDLFKRTEAEELADRAIGKGVPAAAILLETAATNTGENVVFTRRLLQRLGISVDTAICVQKPFMERRTWATVRQQWPELQISVTSPDIPYSGYPDATITKEALINTMVGDLQRIIDYPKRGFQIPQEVPDTVVAAMRGLIALGFDQHLAK